MHLLSFKNSPTNCINIDLPTSKSISNRAIILNAFLNHKVQLTNLSNAADTQTMLAALLNNISAINIENAGTCMRFLTAYFACIEYKQISLFCSERMKQRPIKVLVDALKELGADIEYLEKKNAPPLKINGTKLIGKTIVVTASESSQYITALMLIGPFIQNGLSIQLVGEIASFDYIKMTASLMVKFGFEVDIKNEIISIKEYSKKEIIASYNIEKDWSGAAFWYLISVLNPSLSICLNELSLNSIQGDKITAEIFEKLGVISTENYNGLVVQKSNISNNNLQFNLIDCIDLAPALCVACAALNINATISGLKNLVIKESNRLQAIVTELRNFGFTADHTDDAIIISETNNINFDKTILINSYNDHRIAMAFAPLAFKFNNLTLDDKKVVSKSYPTFFDDLEKVGITISN